MANRKGPSGANAEAFSSLSENAQYRATISHPVKFPSPTIQGCDHSPRHTQAVVRHVECLDGPAAYICRECFTHLVAVEIREIVVDCARRELAELFRYFCPRAACGLGGGIRALAAMMAPIGERRASVR
jgi:hypothetical protein